MGFNSGFKGLMFAKFRHVTLKKKAHAVTQLVEALRYIAGDPFYLNTLRTESFKLFKRPFPGFLTMLTL